MAFTYRDMGRVFHKYVLRIFHNSWMDCRDAFHAALCLYYCITGKKIPEYEAYWLSTINLWGGHFTSVFSVFSVMAGWIAETLFMLFFACVTNTTKLSMKQTGLPVF